MPIAISRTNAKMLDERQTALADAVVAQRIARRRRRSPARRLRWALHGTLKTALDTAASLISRRTEPRIKLH